MPLHRNQPVDEQTGPRIGSLPAGKMEMRKAAVKRMPGVQTTTGLEPVPMRSNRSASHPKTGDSQTISPFPADVLISLKKAVETGQWLIAVCRIENERLLLDRTAMNFPVADLDLACRLFVENVTEMKNMK
jgi:hypothetical protein